eukprot:Polyplicarium_translucidae@DN1332_c0_g1_i1.p2
MTRVGGVASCTIELSTKVVTNSQRLRSTLLHEACHIAQFLLEKETHPPHGPAFKKWASIASSVYPEHKVTTTHRHSIHLPHRFRCAECGHVYGRHSKSINTDRSRCGRENSEGSTRKGTVSRRGGQRHTTALSRCGPRSVH